MPAKGAPMITSPEDHVAISNLLARYCLTLDLDDVEGWVALFTADATYEVYGRSFRGHDGLRKMLSGAPGGLHLGGPPVIEMVDGDHARTRRNLLFVEQGDGPSRCAVYDDELHRTAVGWRIASTRCRFIVADGLADRPGG
jgi:SnoaL-like domain